MTGLCRLPKVSTSLSGNDSHIIAVEAFSNLIEPTSVETDL